MKNRNKYQSTLGYALLIYMCIIVVLITLIPFEFRMPERFHITWSTNFSDLVTNIFLFIPVGFLFKLICRKNRDIFCLQPLILGVLLSMTVESIQLFIPGRYTQVIDVIINGLGSWLGGMIFVVLGRQLKEKRVSRLLALEMPLMGLVYLLIPLMWLNALGTGEEEGRLWLLLLLAVMGAGAICSIYANRFKHRGNIGYTQLSAFTMCWFVFCSLPALPNFPVQIAIFGASVIIFVQLLARLLKPGSTHEKRFEIPTLKKLLPIYMIYLLLLAAWPTTIPAGEWHSNIVFQGLVFKRRIVLTFRFIEFIAAFTVLGYMIAEMRGRKNESVEKTLCWSFFIAIGSAIFIEILKTYPAVNSISILSIIVIILTSLYGAVIYRLQLSAIQQL